MDILIKDWYKPKDCSRCPLGTDIGADSYICQITHEKMFLHPISIVQTCPLIPVPEHGRLIDADKLKKDNPSHMDADVPYVTEVTVEEIIDDAPTVLEGTNGHTD